MEQQQPYNNYPPNPNPQVQFPQQQPQQFNPQYNGNYQNNMMQPAMINPNQPQQPQYYPQQQQQQQFYNNNNGMEPMTQSQQKKKKKNKKNKKQKKDKKKKKKEKESESEYSSEEEYSESGSYSSSYESEGEGWDILDSLPGIYIEQKLEILEVVLDVETKNSYNIYGTDEKGNKVGDRLFKAKESSDCCMRWCCPGNQRPFTMKLKDTVGEYDDYIAFGERKFKCTCFCFNRPEIKLYEADGKEKDSYIGKIKHIWSCCTLVLEITDEKDKPLYYIEGSECQLGVCCSDCCCKACQEAKFKILDADRNQVSTIQKKSSGCVSAMFTDQDFFSMLFPKNATPGEKALLLMAGILIDFQYFETNPAEDDNNY